MDESRPCGSPWLPERLLTSDGTLGPLDTAEQRDSVSLALLVLLLERLTPRERAVFVLREAFGYRYREIAQVLELSEVNCRQLDRRARRRLAELRPRFRLEARQWDRLVERFLYRVPGAAELPERLQAVLGVIHLLFTTGHTAPSGSSLVRPDLVSRALHLTRMLRALMPDEREYGDCSRCCWSSTPGGPPGLTPPAGCCGSRTRTAPSGTVPPSPRRTR